MQLTHHSVAQVSGIDRIDERPWIGTGKRDSVLADDVPVNHPVAVVVLAQELISSRAHFDVPAASRACIVPSAAITSSASTPSVNCRSGRSWSRSLPLPTMCGSEAGIDMGISWEYWNRTGVSPSGCRTQLALNLDLEVRYELNRDVLAMDA
jgi:hypothetical protein